MNRFFATIFTLLFAANVFAAVSANTIWNIDPNGSSANGGCFDSTIANAGTNLSLSALTAGNTLTGAACAGAGNVFTHANASAAWIGNCISSNSGTGVTTTSGLNKFQVTAVSGTSVTVSTNQSGTSLCTGVSSNAAINVGGYYKFYNASGDTAFSNQIVAGNIVYIKTGTYNSTATATTTGGSTTGRASWIGYNTTQGDTPTWAQLPQITFATTGWTFAGGNTLHKFLSIFTSAATNSFILNGSGGNHNIDFCRFENTNETAGASAFRITQHGSQITNSEFVSPRGVALSVNTSNFIYGNWIHDSDIGVNPASTISGFFANNLFSGIVTSAASITAGTSIGGVFLNNTFYGRSSSTPLGIGINAASGVISSRILQNIFYGLATGLNHADANQTSGTENFNNFFGNTTNRTNFPIGPNSIATDPRFANVVQRSGTTATTSATNTLNQIGATFQTWGIAAGDYIYISKSGATVGIYKIASVVDEDSLTTDQTLAADATANGTWYITKGLNWEPSQSMSAKGKMTNIGGTSTNSYIDLGAAQRRQGLPRGRN